ALGGGGLHRVGLVAYATLFRSDPDDVEGDIGRVAVAGGVHDLGGDGVRTDRERVAGVDRMTVLVGEADQVGVAVNGVRGRTAEGDGRALGGARLHRVGRAGDGQ